MHEIDKVYKNPKRDIIARFILDCSNHQKYESYRIDVQLEI